MATRNKNILSKKRRESFLGSLANGLSVKDAANSAGIGLRTAYTWRKNDETFATEWEEAYEMGADALYSEAHNRAVKGIDVPIYHQGHQVGAVKKYSDTLLIFLMKSRDPERYCDRVRAAKVMRKWDLDSLVNASGSDGNLVEIVGLLNELADEKSRQAVAEEKEQGVH